MSAGAAAHARARRPFEPEHAQPDDAARARAARFADRELDVLAEQGNFERARVLLARRTAAGDADADVYLDAIRLERSAAPAGAAWQAWASRAFESGAEIAGALVALIPQRELCAYLIAQQVGWATLAKQPNRAAARELLRMRLERQLLSDPAAALSAIDDRALRAATDDPALRVLVLGVIAAALWSGREGALVIARDYGVDQSAPPSSPDAGEADAQALLANAVRLFPAWLLVQSPSTCPVVLARFMGCAAVVSRVTLAQLGREVMLDLRARPSAYLKCADAFARLAPELGSWLISECDAAREAFPARDTTQEIATAERALAPVRATLRNTPLARLAPWPLSRLLARQTYTRAIRPVLLDAIVQHAASVATLCAGLRAPDTPRGPALAALLERDRGLAIVSALAAFAHTAGP